MAVDAFSFLILLHPHTHTFVRTQTTAREAMFLQFTPAVSHGMWSANKLGEWISSTEIVDGGTKHLHGVMEPGIRFQTPAGQSFAVETTDAAVANFGNLTAYPSPVHTDADTETYGASFVLWDNLWYEPCPLPVMPCIVLYCTVGSRQSGLAQRVLDSALTQCCTALQLLQGYKLRHGTISRSVVCSPPQGMNLFGAPSLPLHQWSLTC